MSKLNRAGFRVVVATNQPGLGRKLLDIETLVRIHEKMCRELDEIGGTVEAVFFCPHRPSDRCRCRKPQPGLFLDIASRLGVALEGIPAVGDSLPDLGAARAVGARSMLVLTGNGQTTLEHAEGLEGVEVYKDLSAVAEALLSETARG